MTSLLAIITALVILIFAVLYAASGRIAHQSADELLRAAQADKKWAEDRHVEATALLMDAQAQAMTTARLRGEWEAELRGMEVGNG